MSPIFNARFAESVLFPVFKNKQGKNLFRKFSVITDLR